VESWGGISYALEALSVVLPEEWVIKPLLKLGEDLSDKAQEYIGSIPRVETGPGVREVPEPNYQVELQYQDENTRQESIKGGVAPWTWAELEPLIGELDAVYLNFITGFETGVDTARALPENASVPLYADLHSLFLGLSPFGQRIPRELPDQDLWLSSFDAVQVNWEEFALLGGTVGDPWAVAADAVGPKLKLIAVTLGPEGAACVEAPGFSADPASWPSVRSCNPLPNSAQEHRVPLGAPPLSGDPTGCGDVWGATFFARLLGGDSLEGAMREANRMAAGNLGYRGAQGLRHHLRSFLRPYSRGQVSSAGRGRG
jgi:sugar/nucleoside kinase (ribokinase family)